mmetsp:Transcript_1850/g.4074  ORF Transcript_1850/g.4074 Transcript_1850/m.4074 type:complete len:222 (-) Transcript_1850:2774-3439(-)
MRDEAPQLLRVGRGRELVVRKLAALVLVLRGIDEGQVVADAEGTARHVLEGTRPGRGRVDVVDVEHPAAVPLALVHHLGAQVRVERGGEEALTDLSEKLLDGRDFVEVDHVEPCAEDLPRLLDGFDPQLDRFLRVRLRREVVDPLARHLCEASPDGEREREPLGVVCHADLEVLVDGLHVSPHAQLRLRLVHVLGSHERDRIQILLGDGLRQDLLLVLVEL